MLAGQLWEQGKWGAQSGSDFHVDVLTRELRPAYQRVLRGNWAASARGDAPYGIGWVGIFDIILDHFSRIF